MGHGTRLYPDLLPTRQPERERDPKYTRQPCHAAPAGQEGARRQPLRRGSQTPHTRTRHGPRRGRQQRVDTGTQQHCHRLPPHGHARRGAELPLPGAQPLRRVVRHYLPDAQEPREGAQRTGQHLPLYLQLRRRRQRVPPGARGRAPAGQCHGPGHQLCQSGLHLQCPRR